MQPDKAMAVLEFLIPTMEREHATTVKVLSAVPAAGSDYAPDSKSKKALELVWHIAASEQYFMTGATKGEFPNGMNRPESLRTPADIVAWYKEQTAANHERIKSMTGDDLVRIVPFHGVMHMPAIAYVQLMLTHTSHHRGQLTAYLRPMGAKVPSIYGPSGDEDPFAAEAKA